MYYFLSLLCGILLAAMIPLNGGLADIFGLHSASVFIHITGLIVITAIILIKREKPFANRQAFYLYLGGAIGVLTVICNNLAFGRISVSAILALLLVGQGITGLAFDQFGWLGMPKHPFRKSRIFGLLLIVGGIIIMVDRFDFVAVSLSFVAGVITVISRTLNAKLADNTSIRVSTFFNYAVGLTIASAVCLALGRNEPVFSELAVSPDFYLYVGGTLGVCMILISNMIVTKVPAFYLSLLLFIGQVFTGIIIDVIIMQSFSIPILVGGVLVTAGLFTDIIFNRKTIKPSK